MSRQKSNHESNLILNSINWSSNHSSDHKQEIKVNIPDRYCNAAIKSKAKKYTNKDLDELYVVFGSSLSFPIDCCFNVCQGE